MPRLSIIVPCYNVEDYLSRCMDSLLNQTLRDIEIILVDDGSSDKCPFLCDEYAVRDKRVKVIHKTNAGLGYARNSGLEIATGEYVAFVDSDDFVDFYMYETLYNEALVSNADVVFCNFNTERPQGVWNESNEVVVREEWTGNSVKNFMLDMVASTPHIRYERRFQMSVWHGVYRKEIIDRNIIRFHSEREVSSEDFPFQMEFLLRAKKVVFIPQTFYYYCQNKSSLTHTFNPDSFRRIRNLYHIMCEQLCDIEGAQVRLDRFYIGYVRKQIMLMVKADYSDSMNMLSLVMDDKVWKDIKRRFPMKELPIYSKCVLFMILRKQKFILLFIVKMMIMIKK